VKATKAVVLQRVEAVLQIVLLGGEFPDIRQYASENDPDTGRPWNVSERQLWRYQQAALKLCVRRLEKDREKTFARHLLQRRAMYARAMEAGDWRTALAVAKDEAELHGLYPPKKVAPTSPDGDSPYNAGLAALLPELRAAVDRLGQGVGGPHPGDSPDPNRPALDPSAGATEGSL
jgi:hypothetical protein